jgi:hypothetical protein
MLRPGAYFERNSGSWSSANVTTVPGPGTLDTPVACDVLITYCDMSQANLYVDASRTNNAESDGSDTINVSMTAGNVLSVDISTLNPPSGAQHPSQMMVVVVSPLKATHWNVYVGMTGGVLYLQNMAPIPVSTKSYTLAGDPVLSGYTFNGGQYPDRRLSISPTRQRM